MGYSHKQTLRKYKKIELEKDLFEKCLDKTYVINTQNHNQQTDLRHRARCVAFATQTIVMI